MHKNQPMVETHRNLGGRVSLMADPVLSIVDDLAKMRTVRDVKLAYWAARGAQQSRDLLKATVANFQQIVDYNTARLRVGTIAEQDVLRVQLELDEVVENERLAARVTGDIQGWAALDVSSTDRGSAIDIEWDMRPRSRAMQMAAVLGRPLLRWSHEWVLARGLEQFRRRALSQSHDE